jgi:hypothetical protein
MENSQIGGTMVRRARVPLALLLACQVALGPLGCITAEVTSQSIPSTTVPVQTDTVLGVGQPNAAALQALGNPNALAFLGRNHTYLLVEGGDLLLQASKRLDGAKVGLAHERSLYLKGSIFWGSVTLTYPTDAVVSDAERQTLGDLGFAKARTGALVYRRVVPVKGHVLPKVPMTAAQLQSFKVRRDIAFYNPPGSAVAPVLRQVVLTPLALATDLVILPVQLGGLAVILIAFSCYSGP